MKRPNLQVMVDTLSWYANQTNYFGAPAPIYGDSGHKARQALETAFLNRNEWWNDKNGLSLSDVQKLQKRLGQKVFDALIYTGGISGGNWLPWPGTEGDPVRNILRLYANRLDWKQHG